MFVQNHKQTVRRYVDAFNSGDIDTLRTIFSPEATVQGVLGKGGFNFAFTIWRESHDSLQGEIDHRGNHRRRKYRSRAIYSETGTFIKPFRAFPGVVPTGKSYTLLAMEWFTFDEAGRILSRYGARDGNSQARQIGAI